MISFEEAYRTVIETAGRLGPGAKTNVPLEESLGLALAEDVRSDRDIPPFNRSAMDGYALRSADVARCPAELDVAEVVPAGRMPQREVARGRCAKIMTGAPVPEGADAVVMVEHTEAAGEGRVRILLPVEAGANVCLLGEDLRRGDTVLRAGRSIRPQEIAVLASLGFAEVPVFAPPRVAVLSTGNEIVPVGSPVKPGQVRDCNAYSFAARAGLEGARVALLGIASDDVEALDTLLADGLTRDMLVISGGVSVSERDLVPDSLRRLGVELIFEKVAMKPGRPTVFGLRGRTLVFGLPGNPVSVQVIAELLVVPALRLLSGHAEAGPRTARAILTAAVKHKGGRRTHVPVALGASEVEGEARLTATPVEYHGSGDFVGFSRADALAVLPEAPGKMEAGTAVDVVLLGRGGPSWSG